MNTDLPNLLNESQAAKVLGVQMPTLRRWRWAGEGPTYFKVGRAVRYDPADLTAFIAAGKRVAAAVSA